MILDWDAVDTVLLDMDGTLLDLAFDNYFWSVLIPQEYAKLKGLSLEETKQALLPHFIEIKGTLEWYNIDYWSSYLGFDVAALKVGIQDQAKFLPHAEFFLEKVNTMKKRSVIATNADPKAFMIKNAKTQVGSYVEEVISSHDLGYPKEKQEFWYALEEQVGFDKEFTLFVDDSPAVLQSAYDYGIKHIAAIQRPDTSREGSVMTDDHAMSELPESIYRITGVIDLVMS